MSADGQRPMAAHGAEQARVDRVGKTGEDGRHEDGEQKRLQHRHERGGDAGDEDEQECLPELAVGHGMIVAARRRFAVDAPAAADDLAAAAKVGPTFRSASANRVGRRPSGSLLGHCRRHARG